MKDISTRLFRILVWAWLVWYLWCIYFLQAPIVWDYDFMSVNNLLAFTITWIVWLLILWDWIKPLCFNKPRLSYFFIWLFLILFWAYWIEDNPEKYIFLSDIIRIVWVLTIILGLAWLLTPAMCKEKLEESKVEIIEA